MSTTKSHKSRKTDDEPSKPRRSVTRPAEVEPRQRTLITTGEILSLAVGSSPVEGSSSLVPATTAPLSSDTVKNSPVATDVPTELPPEKQPWFRKPTSALRKQAGKIAVMRTAGHKSAEIAKRLKTTAGNVKFVEYVARKNGWYGDDGELVDLEAELAMNVERKVVRNISASLDGQMTNWQTHEMTIAAAKGRGLFKNHEKADGQTGALPVVAIQIVMPPLGAEHQHVLDEANIGGTPAYIEAETVEASHS